MASWFCQRPPDTLSSRLLLELAGSAQPVAGPPGEGCKPKRPIEQLIKGVGFDTSNLRNFYARVRQAISYSYEGVAAKA